MPAGNRTIEMRVPCDPAFLSIIRLAVAGAGSRAGLSVGEIDDVKVAVSEACTNVIDHSASTDEERAQGLIIIRLRVLDGELGIEVEDTGVGFDPKHLPRFDKEDVVEREGGLGVYLMRRLMNDVKIESAPGSGTKVTMIKRPER